MPIAGVVISVHPVSVPSAIADLSSLDGVEIHGSDARGNIVAVLEAASTGEMEQCIRHISGQEHVLHVGLTYLNVEDEAEHSSAVEGRSGSYRES